MMQISELTKLKKVSHDENTGLDKKQKYACAIEETP